MAFCIFHHIRHFHIPLAQGMYNLIRFVNIYTRIIGALRNALAGNLLYMLNGEEPGQAEVRTMDAALTLHAEHGLNASTFSARVTIATLADMHGAITSAIGTLKGPLHGGANERVMQMLEKIGSEENVEPWVAGALERKEKVMGFGHRVYRTVDPRAPILRRLGSGLGSSKWLDLSDRVRTVDGSLGFFRPFGGLRTLDGYPYEGEKYLGLFWEHNFRTVPFEILGLRGLARRQARQHAGTAAALPYRAYRTSGGLEAAARRSASSSTRPRRWS